jgi:hypothetical protein
MAEAAGHKWGQFIGESCEAAIESVLRQFANRHGLFLDMKGPRPARSGTRVRWKDTFGNEHDLDYVLERGGRLDKVGAPVAFIESAWRRYTKHSKNKAQEIQGAVLPIAEKHRYCAPMLGCILAGDYTANAMKQLESVGFRVLYLTYESVIQAFATVGIDARFDERTLDSRHVSTMRKWKRLPKRDQVRVWKKLLKLNQTSLDEFMLHLEQTVKRQISAVRIIPLHGSAMDCVTVPDAIAFMQRYDESTSSGPVVKYEVIIRYDNGGKIEAQFPNRAETIAFLSAFQGGNWAPSSNELTEEVQ